MFQDVSGITWVVPKPSTKNAPKIRCPELVFLNDFSLNFRTPVKVLAILLFEVVRIDLYFHQLVFICLTTNLVAVHKRYDPMDVCFGLCVCVVSFFVFVCLCLNWVSGSCLHVRTVS